MIYTLTISIYYSFIFFALLTLLLTFIASFTIGRKFDRIFKTHFAGIMDPEGIISSKFFYRPLVYMLAIVRGPKYSNANNLGHFYGTYNFKAHATKFELWYSKIFYYCCALGCATTACLACVAWLFTKFLIQ